jgi:hypothetical protein
MNDELKDGTALCSSFIVHRSDFIVSSMPGQNFRGSAGRAALVMRVALKAAARR